MMKLVKMFLLKVIKFTNFDIELLTFQIVLCLESQWKLNALQKQLEMQAEAIANLTSYLKQQLAAD